MIPIPPNSVPCGRPFHAGANSQGRESGLVYHFGATADHSRRRRDSASLNVCDGRITASVFAGSGR
jgi:hypothetical protein